MDTIGLIALFDGSFDGLLTVVYKRFYSDFRPELIMSGDIQHRLGLDISHVETDTEKSAVVYEGILRKLGHNGLQTVYQAYLRNDPDIYTSIYRYILFGFKVGSNINDYMHLDFVRNVQRASARVAKDAMFSLEFLRFKESTDGVLFAEFSPENNCLPIVANHFSDRFRGLKWIITDRSRKITAISTDDSFFLTDEPFELPETSEKEQDFTSLWKLFHKTIANENRANPKLQRQLMPLKYRKYVTEFNLNTHPQP